MIRVGTFQASLVAQMIKNLPAMQETCLCPWVGKIPWRRAWQPTLVFLLGESPWTEEPGGLQSVGSQRVGHDRVTKPSTAQSKIWRERVSLSTFNFQKGTMKIMARKSKPPPLLRKNRFLNFKISFISRSRFSGIIYSSIFLNLIFIEV